MTLYQERNITMILKSKPIEFEAFQFGIDETPYWFKGTLREIEFDYDETSVDNYGSDNSVTCRLYAPNGEHVIYKNDYVIRHSDGTIHTCRCNLLNTFYDIVEV